MKNADKTLLGSSTLDVMGDGISFVKWKHKTTLLPAMCIVTGDRIPMFSKAVLKEVSYYRRTEVCTENHWVSLKGYTFLELADKLNE